LRALGGVGIDAADTVVECVVVEDGGVIKESVIKESDPLIRPRVFVTPCVRKA
jgi:hypothetical protein